MITVACSCVNTKNATYFNNLNDSEIPVQVQSLEPVIQKSDLLSISVNSLNEEASKIFNAPNSTVVQASRPEAGVSQASGYLVSQDGNIQFPVLGTIKAVGLTKKQLKEKITQSLVEKQLLRDPIVDVRILNFRVTVLGEVAKPSVISVANEKITLLEALGLAGDLTIYAKRNNIMVLREEEGKKIIKRLNLNSNELFTSPYYYLKSNDIVYVEPNRAKITSTSQARTWLPVVFSGLSVLAIAIDRITR
ncbi:MAG TPA: polysaccharide biosynthesis/export family protein [Flavisolibacter sp.]|nr:polysaccharide biosynthesis/export family protein [Flavisolibacter sp.]